MRLEKNILKQYDSVLKEIVETDRRIRETQAKIERMEKAGTVTDSVSGDTAFQNRGTSDNGV